MIEYFQKTSQKFMETIHMNDYFVIAILLVIIFLYAQYKLLKTANKILEKLTSINDNITQELKSIDNIEYAITGTSQNQKSMQDYIKNNFSSNGMLRSDNTSLRDFLERQKNQHQEIKIIGVELKWLKELWKYKNISGTTSVGDKQYRELILRYHYEWLIARGIEGEALDTQMKKYEELDKMFDNKNDES
jgi:cell division protein FtsL